MGIKKVSPQDLIKQLQDRQKKLKKLLNTEVAVGITEDQATSQVYETGATVGQVGAIHEFGYGIKKRSFINNTVDKKQKEIKEELEKRVMKILDEDKDIEKEFSLLGTTVQNFIKEAFTNKGYGTWPDIEEATKKRKGSSQILIENGTLRRAIRYMVREKKK